MPIQRNNFSRYADTAAADRAALEAMGAACLQVTQPNSPVGVYPPKSGRTGGNLKRSHRYAVSGDHVDIGVTAHYGGYVHNGTSKQRAQPWLRKHATANENSIKQFGIRAWEREVGR